MKHSAQFIRRKISVEFVQGPNRLNGLKMAVTFNSTIICPFVTRRLWPVTRMKQTTLNQNMSYNYEYKSQVRI